LINWNEYEDATLNVLNKHIWFANTFNSRLQSIMFIIRMLSNGREKDGENKSLRLLLRSISEKEAILKDLIAVQEQYNEKINHYKDYIRRVLPDSIDDHYVFYDDENKIPQEFLGMCANFIVQKYKVPAFVLKEKENTVICEARCNDGFNLVECFNYCKNVLLQYGGHAKAAGFTADRTDLTAIIKMLGEYTINSKEDIYKNKKINIDAVVNADKIFDLKEFLQDDLDEFQPFGQGNPKVVYLIRNFYYSRDNYKLNIRYDDIVLEPNKKYDLVINIWGSTARILDFTESESNI